MKITVENQDGKACKHEVGNVYWNGHYYLLVVEVIPKKYSFLFLGNGCVHYEHYETMAELDANNPNDVLVDAELIIRR